MLWVTLVQVLLKAKEPYLKRNPMFLYIGVCVCVYFYTLYFAADKIAHCVNLLLMVWETWGRFLFEAAEIYPRFCMLEVLVSLCRHLM